VARRLLARTDGLTAEQAAQAVGLARSNLYRWAKDDTLKSRRPRRVRPKTWTPPLRQAVERLRRDFPMWAKAKLGPMLRAEGVKVSDATAGRIIADPVARRVVQAVPASRKRPYACRWTAKRRFAHRLLRDLAVSAPGGLVQLDTFFVNLTLTKAIKHLSDRQNGPSARPSTAPLRKPPQVLDTPASVSARRGGAIRPLPAARYPQLLPPPARGPHLGPPRPPIR
jgi:hypothetical protein